MRSKPDLVWACRRLSSLAAGLSPDEAAALTIKVTQYERSDELGGKECAALIRAVERLRAILSLRRLPDEDLQRDLLSALHF